MKNRMHGLLVLLCLIALSSAAHTQDLSDVEIKAGYILKLAKFTTWKGQHLTHINFCYIESPNLPENASVGHSFAKLVRDKNVSNEWNVRLLRNINNIGNCNMLFISATEEDSLNSILLKVSDHDILTMSDAEHSIYKDVMLGFAINNEGRVKMEANLKTIRKTNVMISATVLELMQEVVK